MMNLGEVLSSAGKINFKNPISNTDNSAINGDSFSSVLKNAMDDMNTQQTKAYSAMQEIATGKVENLQEAVKQIEQAELSLKLGLEIKNRALGAYKQVMAMQV
jgi:flagellar hook-basal body complex protein FliE